MGWIGERSVGNILDVGCANGGLNQFIPHGRVSSYTGVDLDRVRIDSAKNSYPKANFYVMDATYGLPFEDGTFDTTICADCLEHVPRGIASEMLWDLVRVSSDRVIITLPTSDVTIPNVDHVWSPTESEMQLFLQGIEKVCDIEITHVEDFALILITKRS